MTYIAIFLLCYVFVSVLYISVVYFFLFVKNGCMTGRAYYVFYLTQERHLLSARRTAIEDKSKWMRFVIFAGVNTR